MSRIRLGVFDRFGIRGLWAHPLSEALRYRDLDYWIEKARLLEDSGFDFLFLADVLGYGTDDDGYILPAGVRSGNQLPRMDPLALIPAMAAHTKTLGFITTALTALEPPAKLARTLSSFDHVTNGRIAWNVVTGTGQDVIARLYGQGRTTPHDERYRIADDYLTLMLKFWEGCWEDDAYRGDKATKVFADPDKIHRIDHEGPYYKASGYLTAPPTAQRTPMLVQAGTSEKGKDFAARYAELIFLQSHIPENIADIRDRASSFGRNPEDIRFFSDVRVYTGESLEDAQREQSDFEGIHTAEAAAAAFKTLTGIDLLPLDPDQPLTQLPPEKLKTELGQTALEHYIARPGERDITVREILRTMRSPVAEGSTFVGLGPDVAEGVIDFVDRNNLDGIMVDPVFDLHTIRNFATYVIPELSARGRLPEPEGATVRSRMMGYGDRLPAQHPGAAYRPRA